MSEGRKFTVEVRESMTTREVEKKAGAYARGVLYVVLWFTIAVGLAGAAGRILWGPDDTDAGIFSRSGFALRTDHGTGCEYLETKRGYLIPRVNGRGEHLGCRAAEAAP